MAKLPPPVFAIWPSTFIISELNNRDAPGGKCWPIATEADLYEMTGGFGNNAVCASFHYGPECRNDLGA